MPTFDQLTAAASAADAPAEALFALGDAHDNGTNGAKKDLPRALELYLAASAKGHPTATRYAAYALKTGAGAKVDVPRAIELYTTAANVHKDAKAMACLGYFYEKGVTAAGTDVVATTNDNDAPPPPPGPVAIAPDTKKAAEWYERAAAAGDEVAAFNAGLLFEKGTGGVGKDPKKALECFRSVADKPTCRNAAALINAGLYFEKAEGGIATKDMVTALKYYKRAALLGDATAMAIVGCCYETGQGVAVSYDEAANWYAQGAMKGNTHAKNGLKRLVDEKKVKM